MRQYETSFLLSPNLSEEEIEKIILRMADIVSKKKGRMIDQEKWGKRKLAYPIKKFEEAFYVFFHYESESAIPAELERRFKQTDAVIRFLTVKKEGKEPIHEEKKEKSEAEKEILESEEKKEDKIDLNQESLSSGKTTKEEK